MRRVLVVDDSALIRELATLALGNVAGWEVRTADSGADAVAKAAAAPPDVILLDVVMPEMDGPATYARLQSDPATRDIPVILVTARAGDGDGQLESLGVAGVIAKPFQVQALAKEVASVLGWSDR